MPRTTVEVSARAAAARRRLSRLALLFGMAFAAAGSPPAALAENSPVSPDLVISQVYTRGGEPGAPFNNDFVEIFNRGNTTVNLADYSLQVLVNLDNGASERLVPITIRFPSAGGGFPVAPGKYVLYEFENNGPDGAPLPTPDSPLGSQDIELPPLFGRVALVKGMAFHRYAQFGCAVGVDAALADFFSYGPTTCVEGGANFPAPTVTAAAVRNSGGCADTDDNVADFSTAAPAPRNSAAPANLCNLPAPANTMEFEVASASIGEGAGFAEIFVTRAGDTSDFAYFHYATGDDTASERTDYTTTLGSFVFGRGETRTSFRIPVTDDARPEGTETLFVSLNTVPQSPSDIALGGRHIMRLNITDNDAAAGANPIDSSDFFVRQHYADFLSRPPDEAGRLFWTNDIDQCGADAQCREVKRINVSAAFFLSIEFQETGFYAYRAYKAAFLLSSLIDERPRAYPLYRELWRDAHELAGGVVVGVGNWRERLEANKFAYADEFVRRPEFRLRYPLTMTAAQFVDALNANTGGSLTQGERDEQVSLLNSAGNGDGGRALTLKRFLDDEDFKQAEFRRAFVLMQYFGYLRRNPNDSPEPGFNFAGYDWWLEKLHQFNGDYIRAEMVKAFISSAEYRQRFGQ
jgi:hypothetical protein